MSYFFANYYNLISQNWIKFCTTPCTATCHYNKTVKWTMPLEFELILNITVFPNQENYSNNISVLDSCLSNTIYLFVTPCYHQIIGWKLKARYWLQMFLSTIFNIKCISISLLQHNKNNRRKLYTKYTVYLYSLQNKWECLLNSSNFYPFLMLIQIILIVFDIVWRWKDYMNEHKSKWF